MKKIMFLLSFMLLIISCSDDNVSVRNSIEDERGSEEIQIRKSYTKYDLITHVTSGLIHHNEPVCIILNSNRINEINLNKSLNKNTDFFNIEPFCNIDIQFENDMLILIPKNGWNMREKYRCKVNFSKLFPDIDLDFDIYEFNFETNGIEIFDVSIETITSIADKNKYKIKGKIEFNSKIEQNNIDESVVGYKVDNKGEKIYFPLILELENNKKIINVSSPEMKSDGSEDDYIYIEVIKDKLDITKNQIYKLKNLQNKKFELQSSKIADNNGKYIQLQFNKELNSEIDLKGFFYIEPSVDFSISKRSKKY